MAVDKKLTDLATASDFDTSSWFLLVDPTDTTMDDSGTDLKVQAPDLIKGLLPDPTGKADKVLATDGLGGLSWVAQTAGGTGTVTSVALTVPSWLNVSGSPVTTSGTLAITLDSGQTANRVLASPDGVTGAVSIRALVAADIPNLPAAQITSGTIATARLGSGTANATKFLQGDQTWQTLNQAAVSGLTTTDSPTFAGLTVGSTSGLLKRTSGVLGTATSGTDYEPPITAGTSAQYLKGDKSLGTLNQAAVAGLTTASSPTFAGLTVGTLSGLLKATTGVVSAATAGTDYLTTSYAGTSSITTVGTITSGTWTGTTIAVANGGTGQTTAANAINALLPTQTSNSGKFLTTNGTVASWGSPAGAGTVTSVDLTVPSWLTVSGNPVTGAGTLAVTATTGQTANRVIATPDGTTGAVSLRALVAADIPTLAASQVTAPGSDGQFLRNTSGAITGSTRLVAGSGNSVNLVPTADPGTPAVGDLWVDSTQKVPSFLNAGLICRSGGIIWQGLSAGTAVSNTTSQTSLLAGTTSLGSLTIPANTLIAGKMLQLQMFGTLSSTGSPTITVSIYLGTTAICTSVASTVTNGSSNTWMLNTQCIGLQVQAIGASGKVAGEHLCAIPGLVNIFMPSGASGNSAPSQVTVDTTADLAIDFRVQWSAASTSNTMQLKGGCVRLDG
jgi:hypothetical protein